MKTLSVLGSTGSIGTQTLDVVRDHPDLFRVQSLSVWSNVDLLVDQVRQFSPTTVVIGKPEACEEARKRLDQSVEVRSEEGSLEAVASAEGVDIVVNGLVGFAGLSPTVAAARAGKRIALANKESLVVAGDIVMREVAEHGAEIIPVDSEHSALFQCLVGERVEEVDRMILTASGGPFRRRSAETFEAITRADALDHPNWSMGAKITIDSATMMNKGLEVIEAARLFGLPGSRIEVVVHPESIIHSMVLFLDGSIKAQLSHPDMRMPIRLALGWPQRLPGTTRGLNFAELGALHFEAPDTDRFPALRLAYEALDRGGSAPTVLNGANEIAVAAFLEDQIRFVEIPQLVERALSEAEIVDNPTLNDIYTIDKRTRLTVRSYISGQSGTS